MGFSNEGIERKLASDIEDVKRRYDEVVKQLISAEKLKSELDETLHGLKKALQFYSSKPDGGKVQDSSMAPSFEFADVRGVRDAVHIALKKYGDMDKEQLKNILISKGFSFGSKKPIPSIHFALVNDKKVTITDKGTYQWVGYDSPKIEIISLPKGIIKFFRERNNQPATVAEVLEGILKMGVRTTSKDLKGNLESELMYSNRFDRTPDDKFSLKKDMFVTA